MKTLKLASELPLPLHAVTEKLAWLGRTGSGKTYGAMKLAEVMLDAGAQIGVMDPVGVWRGLRVPATKGGRSFAVVVFGGLPGYDLPIEPTAGELVADLVSDRGLSFVLDISQMIPSEQQRFVRDFGARFFHRRKAAPSAVHLFLEECQEYIPENPSGLEAQTLGVMQRLWKLGRNFGIGGSLISQRPQEIAKKALNMSGTLFAFQMTGPQERKAIKAWVADHGVATDIEAVLQKLAVGHTHVESPTFLQVSKTVAILPRETADLSSTPTVVGCAQAPRPLTPIDVAQLTEAMAATIEKAKADDPKALRARIAELERAARPPAAVIKSPADRTPDATKTVEILTDADRELLEKVGTWLSDHRTFVNSLIDGIDDRLRAALTAAIEDAERRYTACAGKASEDTEEFAGRKSLARVIEKLDRVSAPAAQPPALSPGSRVPAPTRAAVVKMARHVAGGSGGRPGPQQRILDALAWGESLGLGDLDRTYVALLADASPTSSAFANNLGALRSAGLIEYPSGGRVGLTPDGRGQAGTFDAPASSEDLQQRLYAKLPRPQVAILEALVGTYPQAVERTALASAAGASETSSAYANNLGALRTLGLIDYPSRRHVVAKPVLFLHRITA